MKKARPSGGRATLRDVAKAASVSPMTVSNVINRQYNAMSAETRRRVEDAIGSLNYRPHTPARSLRLSQWLSIGMLIVDESPTFLADPFITQVVAGLSNELSRKGYALLLERVSADRFDQSQLVASVRSDGLCVLLSGTPETRSRLMDSLAELGQPLVVFQEHLGVSYEDSIVIREDDYGGGALLTKLLLDAGCRQFVMLVPGLSWPAIEERARGARDLLSRKRTGITFNLVDCGVADFEATQHALSTYILENGVPDAILAGNDQMGIAAVKQLKALGRGVPRDVRVTGFNAFDFWQYSDPVLTSIRSPAYPMGVRGAEALLGRLRDGRFTDREIVLSVELQPGESS